MTRSHTSCPHTIPCPYHVSQGCTHLVSGHSGVTRHVNASHRPPPGQQHLFQTPDCTPCPGRPLHNLTQAARGAARNDTSELFNTTGSDTMDTSSGHEPSPGPSGSMSHLEVRDNEQNSNVTSQQDTRWRSQPGTHVEYHPYLNGMYIFHVDGFRAQYSV